MKRVVVALAVGFYAGVHSLRVAINQGKVVVDPVTREVTPV
jgi:hypothetical protein